MEHWSMLELGGAVKPDCPPPLWAPKGRLGKPCRHSFYSETHTPYMEELLQGEYTVLLFNMCLYHVPFFFLFSINNFQSNVGKLSNTLSKDESIHVAVPCKAQFMLRFTSTNRIEVGYYDEYTNHTKCFWHVSFPLDIDPPPNIESCSTEDWAQLICSWVLKAPRSHSRKTSQCVTAVCEHIFVVLLRSQYFPFTNL